jgi:hypothetical protein
MKEKATISGTLNRMERKTNREFTSQAADHAT